MEKPPFKSFFQDIIDKKNKASGGTANVQPTKGLLGGTGTVKDPEPAQEKQDPINNDAVRESLNQTKKTWASNEETQMKTTSKNQHSSYFYAVT